MLFALLTIATETVTVDSYVSHKDRHALHAKAQKKFELELLRMKKHQDHVKQHVKKQLVALEQKKKTQEKLLASLVNEQKTVQGEVAAAVSEVKKLELEGKKAGIKVAAKNGDAKSVEAAQMKAIKDAQVAMAEKKKAMKTKMHLLAKLKRRVAKRNVAVINIKKAIKRLQEKEKRLNFKIVNAKKNIEAKKREYIAKAMRQLERIAKVKALKKLIKHIGNKLDRQEDDRERAKLINKQKAVRLTLAKLEQRVKIHKMRKAQMKGRWRHIASVIAKMNHYKKGFRYDQKLRALEVKKAIAQVRAVQKEIETVIEESKKVGKVNGVEVERLQQKKTSAMVKLEKARTIFENNQEKGEAKIRNYKKHILRLKINDAKIRISEHRLNKDIAKTTKADLVVRIHKLLKLRKRLGLCPFNKLRIKRRLRTYRKEVKIASRKIRRNNKQIHLLNIRLASLDRRFRTIEKRRIAKIIMRVNALKSKLHNIRHRIMAIRIRKASHLKEVLLVKLRTLKNKESSLKNSLRRYLRRNGHVLRKLEQLRKQEREAARLNYKMKATSVRKLRKVVAKLNEKVKFYKAKIAQFKASPYQQIKAMRAMRKLVALLEKSQKKLKEAKQAKTIARSKYMMLRTKAAARLHAQRGELFGRQAWLLSSLRAMANQEKQIRAEMKKTINVREMRGLYKQQVILRHEGRRSQKKLFRVVKRLQKIQKLLVRHNQYRALRRLKKVFKVYNHKFVNFELKKFGLKNVMKGLQQQEAKLFVKKPYIQGIAQKEQFKQQERKVKNAISEVRSEFATVEKQEKRTIIRALKLGREYQSLLNVKMSDLKNRLTLKQNERPNVSKRALYSVDPVAQRKAVRRLKVIDRSIEELDGSIERTEKKQRKTVYVIGKLRAALAPKGKRCTAQTDCKICRKLGKVAKFGIRHHESDSIILTRLRGVCTAIEASRQKECYHQAMAVAMKALHTFDPMRFHVTQVCQQIGKC